MNKLLRDRGMTYVEIIVSLFIFIMVLPMLIEVFKFISSESQKGVEALELSYVGGSYIEELKSISIDELNALSHMERMEYENYYISHSITPYWNGSTNVIYYIIKSNDNSYTTYIFTPNIEFNPSHIVVNIMKYDLQDDIFIDIGDTYEESDIILYCTHHNYDKVQIAPKDNIIVIQDNSRRTKITFKLVIEIYKTPYAENPSLLMETLFEKAI